MWSKVRRLPLSVRLYISLATVLAGIFGLIWWSLVDAHAAPCAPIVCVPLPSLPAPQPSGFATPPPQPQAFGTPTASARPTATPSPSPGVGQPPVQAPLPGQDVGLTALAQGAENGASGLSKQLNSQLNAPNAGGNWFLPIYNKMTTIGVWILLIALLLAVLQYIASRRLGLVASSWFGWAPGSIGITAVAIAVTNLALAITDALCAYVLA
nr:hypothetical protein [Candidatus Dormibacteraeota bacterium]